MTRTTPRAVLAPLAAALLLALAGCQSSRDYSSTLAEAPDINAHSHLGLEYLSLATVSADVLEQFGPDHPYGVHTDDGEVTGYYFEYPYKSGDYRLTQVDISGPGYDLYGIAPGSSLADAAATMGALGFTKKKDHPYTDGSVVYTKYHVYIVFRAELGSPAIDGVLVSVDDPARPHVIY